MAEGDEQTGNGRFTQWVCAADIRAEKGDRCDGVGADMVFPADPVRGYQDDYEKALLEVNEALYGAGFEKYLQKMQEQIAAYIEE